MDRAIVRSFATLVRIREFTPSCRKPLSGSETHRGMLELKQLAMTAFGMEMTTGTEPATSSLVTT